MSSTVTNISAAKLLCSLIKNPCFRCNTTETYEWNNTEYGRECYKCHVQKTKMCNFCKKTKTCTIWYRNSRCRTCYSKLRRNKNK